ncbi:polysaccharide deacetylase family protein [Meridianimaribacter flavus]|uniref:Peptidoglycan/xylan/chitin deacetylase (PgdA/CDA1 family) n=1 Tax=Meridianimaribacter flavus TaxID=571115 RepID=A0ABY2G5A4_9FLAO|nr:polysaccharide deacetylase family protein [Meridianimaribacter flavus]TDY10652.1 peptidoglycan/xylan/chitin deacetylase (PgdA/CDA1 family) [Meridianimaribacter flavus]
MKITPTKTPLVVKKMFPNYIWDIPTEQKTIYLTFDDGPTPEITHWTLNTLKQYNAKATFFCIGSNIEKHPDIFQDIINEGHSIGNHTYNHLKGWKTQKQEYIDDVLKTQSLIEHQQTSKLFRPPYGKIKPKQANELIQMGYKIIMWDVLSFDWDATISNAACLENVISKTKKGSIIVFHDSLKAASNLQYALPKVLEHYSNLGFSFKNIVIPD